MADAWTGGSTIRWEVRPETTDLDRWARVYFGVLVEAKRQQLRGPFGYGLGLVLLVLVIGGGVAGGFRFAGVVVVALLIGVVLAALRTWLAARRLVGLVRRSPAAKEPSAFVADPTGTNSQSASSAESRTWTRYRSARLVDDLVVLVEDGWRVRILPAGAIVSGQSAPDAVDLMSGWIAQARQTSPT